MKRNVREGRKSERKNEKSEISGISEIVRCPSGRASVGRECIMPLIDSEGRHGKI